MKQEDSRLSKMSRICLALPEAEREDMGAHAAFIVRKKKFAYFLNDHHGDGIIGLWCKVLPGDDHALIRADSKRFYMPAYVGSRGWAGLRLDTGDIDWDEVSELLVGSYLLTAPKTLCAQLKATREEQG